MKIIIEIGPNRVTRFLGARVAGLKTGTGKLRAKVHSGYSRVRAAGRALVSKPAESSADPIPAE
jgi:hypothetical protein